MEREMDELPTVAVLLSTYNGERFLEALLDSILIQQNVRLSLLIRDDGSTDKTDAILKRYQRHNSSIQLLEGGHVGVRQSYAALMLAAPKADYYAFADQDDVWFADKIARAVTMMESQDRRDTRKLYGAAKVVTDEQLHPRFTETYQFINDFDCALRGNRISGCTIVFNKAFFDFVQQDFTSNTDYYHDSWVVRVAILTGARIFYDPEPCVYYRQHEANVVGYQRDKKSFWERAKKYFISDENDHQFISRYIATIYRLHKCDIIAAYAKTVEHIAVYPGCLKARLALLCDKNMISRDKLVWFARLWEICIGRF